MSAFEADEQALRKKLGQLPPIYSFEDDDSDESDKSDGSYLSDPRLKARAYVDIQNLIDDTVEIMQELPCSYRCLRYSIDCRAAQYGSTYFELLGWVMISNPSFEQDFRGLFAGGVMRCDSGLPRTVRDIANSLENAFCRVMDVTEQVTYKMYSQQFSAYEEAVTPYGVYKRRKDEASSSLEKRSDASPTEEAAQR